MMFELFSLPAASGLGLMGTSTGAGAEGIGLTTGAGSSDGLVGKGIGTASANVDVRCGCAGSGHRRFRHAWQLKDPDNRSTNMIAQIIRDVFIVYFPSYKARISYFVLRTSLFVLYR